jgi:hypothetical protein
MALARSVVCRRNVRMGVVLGAILGEAARWYEARNWRGRVRCAVKRIAGAFVKRVCDILGYGCRGWNGDEAGCAA